MKEIQVTHRNGEIIFTTRVWDGVDKPDYTEIDQTSIAAARDVIEQIEASISEAEAFNDQARRKRITELESEIARKQAELDKLVAEDQVPIEIVLDQPAPRTKTLSNKPSSYL